MSKMPKYLLVVLAFVQFIFCASLANASDDSIQVTASGIGHTSDEALKDAYKNAVRRAVGVYVLTETVMNNEDIDEKIYANSDGVVSSHEVLETKPLPNNLIEITIKATVQKNNIGRLVGKDKPVVIDKKNIANVSNSLNAMEEVQKSLDLIFKGYPASLLTVEAIGQPVIDETKNVTADTIPMKQTVRIYVNYPEYQKLAKKLMELFDQNNYPKGTNQPLTRQALKSIDHKFNNCFYLFTRRSPYVRTMRYEDWNGIGYCLPGQIIRHIEKFKKARCFLHYRMTDLDSNVLADIQNTDNNCSRWAIIVVDSSPEIFNYKNHISFSSNSRINDFQLALTAPLFSNGYSNYYDEYRCTVYFTVNRKMYENAQSLKIHASLHNEKQEEAFPP